MHSDAPRSLSYMTHSPVYQCGDAERIHCAVLRWKKPCLNSVW